MGVVEIEGTKYKISVADNLRYAECPEHGGWTNPYIGVWIISPKEGTYLKVELIWKQQLRKSEVEKLAGSS